MKQVFARDMQLYMTEINKSYSLKRELYTEYCELSSKRHFNYTKVEYTREKFPKFPLRFRKQIAELI